MRRVSAKQRIVKDLDEAFFRHIWETRPHLSEVSLSPLPFVFGKHMFFVFSHVLAKGPYPRFRHYNKNVVLMTLAEHTAWEFGDRSDPQLSWVVTLEDTLKQEYYQHSKTNFLFFKDHFNI